MTRALFHQRQAARRFERRRSAGRLLREERFFIPFLRAIIANSARMRISDQDELSKPGWALDTSE